MNETANQPLLEVKGLCKSFGDLEVLKSIDQNIYKGEKVAVIGPSGSGKSTFLRCLNCMEDPTGGSIFFGGEDIADMKVDINKHRENIGMVFQQFNLFNNKTVIENIMLAPVFLRIKKAGGLFAPKATKKQIREEEKEKALALLRRIGLEEKANVYPSTLSGGQKQRIAIAGIIALMPEVIIFDESTAMLDPLGRAEVMQTIQKLNDEGITVLHITHYMEEAILADQIVVMDDGEIILDDTPEKVFANSEKLKSVGLDVPQSVEILNALKKSGFELNTNALTPEKAAENIDKYIRSL